MQLMLVRHGHAGRKAEWQGSDKLRPLSTRGLCQAERLVEVLGPPEPTRIISSPYLRCLQTAERFAAHAGLDVEESAALSPDAPAKALRLVRKLTAPGAEAGVVIVTHGEVMGVVLSKIAKEDGIKLDHLPPGFKGCVWELDFRLGTLVEARYVAPA